MLRKNAITIDDTSYGCDYHARHERFVNSQKELLKERQQELAKLQSKANIDASTEKRIKKLQEIVNNIKFSISNMQMQMTLRRPYGL